MAIYPVDSVIQPLNNWSQLSAIVLIYVTFLLIELKALLKPVHMDVGDLTNLSMQSLFSS